MVEKVTVNYDGSADQLAKAGTAPAASGSTPGPVSYYVDSLQTTDNGARYTGPISGVVNAQTRVAMEHWVTNNYRCPVVVEAWTMVQGERTALAARGGNLWAHDSFTSGAPRMMVRDFSDYYLFPADRPQTEYQPLGYYQVSEGSFGGPNATKAHSWGGHTDMTVENMTGAPADPTQLNSARLSTYRTLRVTAEAECFGRFDVLNAWDNALMSAGPCHWTMGVFKDGQYGKGELSGFMSYLKHHYLTTFEWAFGKFGLQPQYEWEDNSLYMGGVRVYAGWVKLSRDPDVLEVEAEEDSGFRELVATKEEAHYLKTWHWFYRMSMSGRTLPDYRTAMWKMTKIRLREMLSKDVVFGVGGVPVSSTLGEVFTSEKAVAILLRWHVYKPSFVVLNRKQVISRVIQDAINSTANLGWSADVTLWRDRHEQVLTENLLSAARLMNDTIVSGIAFGTSQVQGSVRTGRNTFEFEDV